MAVLGLSSNNWLTGQATDDNIAQLSAIHIRTITPFDNKINLVKLKA